MPRKHRLQANEFIYTGTENGDTIYGGIHTDDFIFGLEGNDVLGDQFVLDTIFHTDDEVSGNEGNDTLITRNGSDKLFGNSGDDLFLAFYSAGTNRVVIDGGTGYDEASLRSFRSTADIEILDNKTVITDRDLKVVIRDSVEEWSFF